MPRPARRAPRRLAPVALALLLAAGCGDDVTSPAETLRITTTVSPATFRAGEPVAVTVTVTNTGGRTRYVHGYPCDDPFVVSEASGRALLQAPRACDLILYAPTPVAPAARVTITRLWRGEVGTASGAGNGTTPIPAGDYVLRGYVESTEGERAQVVGAPVAIRVRP